MTLGLGIWGAARGTKRKNPLGPGPEGVCNAALLATYLRDDSGSGRHESNDDAEGNDLERGREADTAKRTMRSIISH